MVSGFEAAVFVMFVMLKVMHKKTNVERSIYQHELLLVEVRIYFSYG